jgi:hypothetical protein
MNEDGQNFSEIIARLTQERNHEQQTCQIWKRRTEQYREDYENTRREHTMVIAHMKHSFSQTKENARQARVEAWELRNANAGLREENEGLREKIGEIEEENKEMGLQNRLMQDHLNEFTKLLQEKTDALFRISQEHEAREAAKREHETTVCAEEDEEEIETIASRVKRRQKRSRTVRYQ